MKCLNILSILFFNTVLFAEELPVVKFPNKEEIEKNKIKNLIKAFDENYKIEKSKREKLEPSQSNDFQISPHHPNRPYTPKHHKKLIHKP